MPSLSPVAVGQKWAQAGRPLEESVRDGAGEGAGIGTAAVAVCSPTGTGDVAVGSPVGALDSGVVVGDRVTGVGDGDGGSVTEEAGDGAAVAVSVGGGSTDGTAVTVLS
jgi:hypothetical protein